MWAELWDATSPSVAKSAFLSWRHPKVQLTCIQFLHLPKGMYISRITVSLMSQFAWDPAGLSCVSQHATRARASAPLHTTGLIATQCSPLTPWESETIMTLTRKSFRALTLEQVRINIGETFWIVAF